MQSAYAQTSDLRMHYLQAGTGEPVILIHGFPETSYEWRHQFPALAEQYAVFAPDTRGFGQTDKPDIRVNRHLLAKDIVNFMDALGIERAAVVGHDWGGIIAFKVAIDWPERVTRLALLDTLCTTWAPGAVHGYWFKAKPYPEQFFAEYHNEFIDTIFAGESDPELPGRPYSPWQIPRGLLRRWASDEDVDHYRRAFADPASQRHAISYYRYALAFHEVHPDPDARHGERFVALGEDEVAEMWLHADGLEKHPRYANFMDYGPEDRHKRFAGPALWMYSRYLSRGEPSTPPDAVPRGNPFVDQFSMYFPDLRVRRVDAGHFFPEELPQATNETLLAFLAGKL
jgi:pimeloyl-ACP methyl ester carboxylesterase